MTELGWTAMLPFPGGVDMMSCQKKMVVGLILETAQNNPSSVTESPTAGITSLSPRKITLRGF
jgi:hypothetical protein